MKDFLDEVIAERIASDPDFATVWPASDMRLQLITLRKRANLTQDEVAERLGISQPRVAELERRPDRVSLGRILRYLQAVGGSFSIDECKAKRSESQKARRVA